MKDFLEHRAQLAVATGVVFALLGTVIWGPAVLVPSAALPSLPAASAILHDTPSHPVFVASDSPEPPFYQYIEVVDGCGPHWEGTCVNMRSGPGVEYPVVGKLRTGIVLRVDDVVTQGDAGWYKIYTGDDIRYPERITTDWYVASEYVRSFTDGGEKESFAGISVSNTQRIIVDISEQKLYAYDGDTPFMEVPISTGLEFTPTPRGTFIIFKKTPSRYMQGPVQGVSDDFYDLPGVPWDLYFTHGGAVIHGAYWHDSFGQQWSHGCVNLPLQEAKKLYEWARVGTPVTVRD